MSRTLPLAMLVLSVAVAGCENGASLGAGCQRASECAPGLVCRFDRCRAECQENRDCAVGQSCVLASDGSGSCTVDSDLGCETGVGRACPSGLACVRDRCQRPCTSASECPSDGECLLLGDDTRFCFDPRIEPVPDAGPRDAGIDAFTTQGDTGPVDTGVQVDSSIDAGTDAALLREGVLDVCIGPRSACAIAADRTVWCWGGAALGQLGDGSACTATVVRGPTQLTAIAGADAIACGTDFACAHVASGRTLCWGANDVGQLGRDTLDARCDGTPGAVLTTMASIPAGDAELVTDVAILSAAGRHACMGDGSARTLLCWGANDDALDPASATASFSRATALDGPGRVLDSFFDSGVPVAQVAVAARSMCVRSTDASVTCWGSNAYNETSADTAAVITAPITHPDFATMSASMVSGSTHRCILDAAARVECFGDARRGQLSIHVDPGGNDWTYMPTRVATTSLRFTSIAASGSGETTCGILGMRVIEGQVICWGDNTSREAGSPTGTEVTLADEAEPYATVVGSTGGTVLADAVRLAMGPSTGCAIDALGRLACWGDADLDPATAPTASAVEVSLGP